MCEMKGLDGSIPPLSTIQSVNFCTLGESLEIRACARDLRLRVENVFYGAIRWNQAKVIRARFC
jgi:hypothetical protein